MRLQVYVNAYSIMMHHLYIVVNMQGEQYIKLQYVTVEVCYKTSSVKPCKRCITVMVRASALSLGGRRFKLRLSHIKDSYYNQRLLMHSQQMSRILQSSCLFLPDRGDLSSLVQQLHVLA